MNLWLLRPVREWVPWHDSLLGAIVRAETEEDARRMVQAAGGTESRRHRLGTAAAEDTPIPAWTDPALSTCVELSAEGESKVLMQDFAGS